MASLLFNILSAINDVCIIQERLREGSVFDTPFTIRRWKKEVHRYRLQRDLELYVKDPSGLIHRPRDIVANCSSRPCLPAVVGQVRQYIELR